MSTKLDNTADGQIKLRERVSNIETRHRTTATIWGIVTVVITILINAFKVFK
ncbi:MAG: hypothetical protein JEZ14_14955 [Marinilabiliaceae bacterium]|nr:hypothetical protein [Marinilabiliaceae bacterium]